MEKKEELKESMVEHPKKKKGMKIVGFIDEAPFLQKDVHCKFESLEVSGYMGVLPTVVMEMIKSNCIELPVYSNTDDITESIRNTHLVTNAIASPTPAFFLSPSDFHFNKSIEEINNNYRKRLHYRINPAGYHCDIEVNKPNNIDLPINVVLGIAYICKEYYEQGVIVQEATSIHGFFLTTRKEIEYSQLENLKKLPKFKF